MTVEETIDLPELIVGPIRYSVGSASQTLRPASVVKIVAESQVKISPRIEERAVELSNGETIIVTARKKVVRPEGIDGVLFMDGTSSHWQNHRLIDRTLERISEFGLGHESQRAAATWIDAIRYVAEKEPVESDNDRGLRPPQLGALFSVGAHWSLNDSPATIVLPTGTGKTETMLAVAVAHQLERVLVVVPSKALRTQTAGKFSQFGILRELNVLEASVSNPVVGVVTRRPKTSADLAIFRDCNVIVAIPSSIAGGTAIEFIDEIGAIGGTLIVDEAHHVAAKTWRRIRRAFQNSRVLQFTATPFRYDEQLVDGSVVYSYPLGSAQRDGYFAPINFHPVYEVDDEKSDLVIATRAVAQLRADLEAGLDHLLMARCNSVARAEAVQKTYETIASELNPILIHSDLVDADERVQRLRRGESKAVVCVNMLGEGVDIPTLKVAAVHDSHKSLAILLQFVGRFARVGDASIGEASVIANIANSSVRDSLEQLYSQDADWNLLLKELSSEAAKEHSEFIEFLENSESFEQGDEDAVGVVSQHSLKPVFSTLFFTAQEFHPKQFYRGLSEKFKVARVWLNDETNTLYFVTSLTDKVGWTKSKGLTETRWDLFVIHYDRAKQLLYLASTYKESHFPDLANAVGAKDQLKGEVMFRSLGRIGRLVFNNLGVTKHGRRNLSFAMYTGVDVKQALSETETQGSRKSNVSGYGWEDGSSVTIGCSYKGRVWSKMSGTIPKFITWAEGIGSKLIDESIDTKSIIENVLIPEWADEFPDYEVLSLEWPYELLSLAENRVTILDGLEQHELFVSDLTYAGISDDRKSLTFTVVAGEESSELATFVLSINGQAGYSVHEATSKSPVIQIGPREYDLVNFLNDYPPLVRFVDLSEVDGNIVLKAENSGVVRIPNERLIPWSWEGVDITKESIWKGDDERQDSIQWRVAQQYINDGFAVVFDDDGAGEAADLVSITEEETHIRLVLTHCKFSGGPTDGRRIKDVVEVASQAVRSARRPGNFKRLLDHIVYRHKNRKVSERRNLFLAGARADLVRFEKVSRFKEVRPEIVIVQPGVSKSEITEDQSIVLGAAVAFLKQTLGLDLDVICSE